MPPGKVVGNREQYQIDALIAKGAYSEVYRCTHRGSGREYAIKVMSRRVTEENNMTQALIREVNAMEIVGKSPNVISLVDKMISKHNFYIVSDLAEGGTLLDYLRRRRQVLQTLGVMDHTVPFFFKQLLLGLAVLHERNVAHRDIKPENLLLDASKTLLMISDFGFACYAPVERLHHRACGTLRYCAPELLCESPAYSARMVDVWAAGVTLYVMLFHVHPYNPSTNNADAMLHCIRTCPYTLPYPIPPEMEAILAMILQPDPSRRATVTELLELPYMKATGARCPKAVSGRASPAARVAPAFSPNNLNDAFSITLEHAGLYDAVDDGFYHGSYHGGPRIPGYAEDHEEEFNRSTADSLNSAGTGYGTSVSALSDESDCGGPSGQASTFSATSECAADDRDDASDEMALQRHSVLLTLKVVFNFFFFCIVLLFALALRLLFNMDVAELPIPERMQRLIQYLLIAPHERAERRRAYAQSTTLLGNEGSVLHRFLRSVEGKIRDYGLLHRAQRGGSPDDTLVEDETTSGSDLQPGSGSESEPKHAPILPVVASIQNVTSPPLPYNSERGVLVQ